MTIRRKIFVTAALVAALAAIGGFGAFSAFTATTQNDNNTIQSGSVSISDSDSVGGSAGVLYSATNQKPGSANGPAARCIRVTYNGSLAAAVKLYRGSVTNGDQFNLTVERGSGLTSANNTMSCAGFTASSTAYSGTLAGFPSSYASSTVDGKAAGAAWNSGDSVDYRFTIYAIDDTTANAHTSALRTGNHSIFWEAQNN
jgi:hypothetical protein